MVIALESKVGKDWIDFLESAGVFFSSPLDLDFAMIREFPEEYGISKDELEEPDEETVVSVLGKEHGDVERYSEEEQEYFDAYRRRFQLGSKPAAHIEALARFIHDLEDTKGLFCYKRVAETVFVRSREAFA